MSDPKAQATDRPTYFQLATKDSAGNRQDLFASFQNGHFVLFEVQGEQAQVMYLLPAASAADIAKVVTERIIDVVDCKPLSAPPKFAAAVLSASHPWLPAEQAAVGALLETKNVSVDTPPKI